MSLAPLDPRLVIARLKAQVSVLQLVGSAADFQAVKSLSGFRTPSAYAVLANEVAQPKPTGTNGPVRQLAEATFGVVVAVRNYRAEDAEKSDDLNAVLAAVRGAIIGWVPNLPMARGCQLVAGQPLDSDSATLLWGDLYSTQYSLGSNP